MSRNYGAGSRDMVAAARIILARSADRRELSFASVDAISDRFSRFAREMKALGIGRMERITRELLISYGHDLADQVDAGEMTPAYGQNLVSAVNSTMKLATNYNWHSVSPTLDCGIAHRSTIRLDPPTGMDYLLFSQTIVMMRRAGMARQASIAELALELGLRSKECSLFDARAALAEYKSTGFAIITEGTKGGKDRVIPIILASQIDAIKLAASQQGKGRNLIPADESWKRWREGGLRQGREMLKGAGLVGFQDQRAVYVCRRYESLCGWPEPVMGGVILNYEIDRMARDKLAIELGHGRHQIISQYCGSSK
jgi:hypothetical protein